MSKRINVILSDSLNDRLDFYAERYGVSKSNIGAFAIGQFIDQLENAKNEPKNEILSLISSQNKDK